MYMYMNVHGYVYMYFYVCTCTCLHDFVDMYVLSMHMHTCCDIHAKQRVSNMRRDSNDSQASNGSGDGWGIVRNADDHGHRALRSEAALRRPRGNA